MNNRYVLVGMGVFILTVMTLVTLFIIYSQPKIINVNEPTEVYIPTNLIFVETPNYTIIDNTVFFGNGLGEISVYPAVSNDLIHQTQYINFTWDGAPTSLDFAFQFTDAEDGKWNQKEAWLWKNISHPNEEPVYGEVTFHSDCRGIVDINFGFIDSDTGWCNETGNGTYWEHDFDSFTTNASGVRLFYNETAIVSYTDKYYFDYVDITNQFLKTVYNGNNYYFIKNVNFETGEKKQVKIEYNVNPSTNGKYSLFVKRSSDSISSVLSSGQYILLDPWFNSSWIRKQRINITENTGRNLTDYQITFNVTFSTGMATDFADLRFLNSSENGELDFWLESQVDSDWAYAWIKVQNISATSVTEIFMYYENPAVTTTSDIENTFIWSDGFVDGVYNTSHWSPNGGLVNSTYPSCTTTFDNCTLFEFDANEFLTTPSTSNNLNLTNVTVKLHANMSAPSIRPFLFSTKTQENPAGNLAFSNDTSGSNPKRWGLIDGGNTFVANFVTTYNNNWQVFQIRVNTTATQYSIDNENLTFAGNVTLDAYSGTLGGASGGSSNIKMTISSWIVAKFVEPEPTTTIDPVQFETGISITLDTPVNGSVLVNTTINFAATVIDIQNNLTNATLFIWFDNTTLFNQTTITMDTSTNISSFNVSDFQVRNGYLWNVVGVNNNSEEVTGANNFTFDYGIIENELIFNNETTEGATETFILNVTIGNTQISTADLVWNGTIFSGTVESTNTPNITLRRDLIIPEVSADTNITFEWNVTFANGFVFISAENNQTVRDISIDDCSTNTIVIINYTMENEETQVFLDGTAENTTIEVDVRFFSLDRTVQITSFNTSFEGINPAAVCISEASLNASQEYSVDITTRYFATDFVPEFHNIQNFTLRLNTTNQNITLLDLLIVDSTEFLITFRGVTFLPVPDAIVNVLRSYVSEGVFKSVESPKTDDSGQAKAHFDLDNVGYQIIVTKNGFVLATFANIAVFCENEVIGDCKINLNALDTGTPLTDFDTAFNLNYNFDFDESTKTITITFSTQDGTTSTVFLNSTKFDRFGDTLVCSDTLTSSSGILTCVIPDSFGNLTIISELFSNGEQISTRSFSIEQDPSDIFGGQGIILAFIIILLTAFLLISSTTGVIIGAWIGIILAGLLSVFNSGTLFGPTSAFIWIFVSGGILLWKITKRA